MQGLKESVEFACIGYRSVRLHEFFYFSFEISEDGEIKSLSLFINAHVPVCIRTTEF